MAKVAPIQTNTNAGEISPLLYGRVDLDRYQNALATCLNAIPLVQGGWSRRPGRRFVAEVKDSSKVTRVRRFEYSVTQAYVIEFDNLFVRFYRNGAPLLETGVSITGITQADPGVVTANAHGYSNGDHVEISGVLGMTKINGLRAKVAGATANTFSLQDPGGNNIDTRLLGAYTSGGTVARVYTLASPYAEADLFQLKFAQTADVLHIVHPSYAPRTLTRLTASTFAFTILLFADGPYLNPNTTGTTLTPSATTGAITITASSGTGINSGAGWNDPGDVGRVVRILHSSTWGYARITSVVSGTVVNATVVNAFGATTASSTWRLGAWCTTLGFPSCVTFYENRAAYAGAPGKPDSVELSRTFRYDDFAPTDTDGSVDDDHAISATMSSPDVQRIRWLEPDDKGLIAGAVNGEFVARRSANGEALTPTTTKAGQSTDNGSADIQAIRAGKAIVMVDRTKRSVHEVAYVYTDDGFRAPEMSLLAEHITKGGVRELAYQKHPQPVIWMPRVDGTLVGFTYNRDQNVLGWHRHEGGGYSDSGQTTYAKVESCTVIPSSDELTYELWMVVQRYINGRSVRYIEVQVEPYERGDDQEDAFYVDAGSIYDGSPATTITGLWHLLGQTVQVFGDGADLGDFTVGNSAAIFGTITLPGSYSVVHVGLGYNSDFKTLRNNAGAADGTAQGKKQRKNHVTVRLHETGQLKIGPDFDNLTEAVFRESSDPVGEAPPFYSGDFSMLFEDDYSTESVVCCRADRPMPCTILALMPNQTTYDP